MATSWAKETKNSSTWTNEREYKPPAKFGKAKFDRSRFEKDKAGTGQSWTNETKNSSSYTNETEN